MLQACGSATVALVDMPSGREWRLSAKKEQTAGSSEITRLIGAAVAAKHCGEVILIDAPPIPELTWDHVVACDGRLYEPAPTHTRGDPHLLAHVVAFLRVMRDELEAGDAFLVAGMMFAQSLMREFAVGWQSAWVVAACLGLKMTEDATVYTSDVYCVAPGAQGQKVVYGTDVRACVRHDLRRMLCLERAVIQHFNAENRSLIQMHEIYRRSLLQIALRDQRGGTEELALRAEKVRLTPRCRDETQRRNKSNILVLVVDDEQFFLDVHSDLLRQLGANIDIMTCDSAEGAIGLMHTLRKRHDSVDAVFLDACLPDAEDDRVAQCARHAALMLDPVSVLVTAHTECLSQDRFQSCAAVIRKPMTLEMAKIVVDFALVGRQAD